MAKRFKKAKEITEGDLASLFEKDKILKISYFDRSKELAHLVEAFNKCKDVEIKLTIEYNIKRMRKFPTYLVQFRDDKLLAKNNYSDLLQVSEEHILKYNVNRIPVHVIKAELTYNLYDLPYF